MDQRDEKLLKKKEKRMQKQTILGLARKKIFPFPNGFIDRLRPYQVAGVPVSIMVMVNELCNGFCFDRAELMSLAFDDAKVVYGGIEDLRITSSTEEEAQHAFIETKAFGGGKTWVVDTSSGLIYDKDYYYKCQKVKVTRVIEKDELMASPSIKAVLASDFEKDKYVLPLLLPIIENVVANSNRTTLIYKPMIERELEHFKKAINYVDILNEVESDIHLMRTDPQKLEEKFRIVRDRYGREISRNGVPNPYYISPEEADAMQAKFEKTKDDPKLRTQMFQELAEEAYKDFEREYEENTRLANEKLIKVNQNPIANFYDDPSM